MKKSFKKISIVSAAAVIMTVALTAVALAAPTSTTNKLKGGGGAKNSDEVSTQVKSRAVKEIDRRLNNLESLSERIEAMRNVSAGEKESLMNSINVQINELKSLADKIMTETASSSLREEIQSITKSYRIYALVMPQKAILAAADRAKTVAGMLEALIVKLESRIAEAKNSGKDVSQSETLLSGIKSKIADAKAQAQSAIDGVSVLKPDEGDQETLHANSEALKDARAKIKAANQDLRIARQDAGKIVKELRQFSGAAATSTEASQ